MRGILIASLLLLTACSEQQDNSFFPLEKGLNWQYASTVTTMDLVKQGKYLVRNMGADTHEGRSVYLQESHNGAQYLYDVSEQGVKRVGIRHKLDIRTRFEPQGYFTLKYPLVKGTEWRQSTTTGVLEVVIAPFRRHYALHAPLELRYELIEPNLTVSVKAGRFSDCVHIRGQGKTRADADKSLGNLHIEVTEDNWYCRGVGLVKTERLEKTDSRVLVQGKYQLELELFERF